MRTRNIGTPLQPYWVAIYCDGEINSYPHQDRLNAMWQAQDGNGESGYVAFQMEWIDDDTVVIEQRATRNELAICVVSPSRKLAEEIAHQTAINFGEYE